MLYLYQVYYALSRSIQKARQAKSLGLLVSGIGLQLNACYHVSNIVSPWKDILITRLSFKL